MNPVLLLILDGWGYSQKLPGNAIARASTPCMDRLCKQFPWAVIQASGEAVGLPSGQMGNSEVGHLNIGAGRIVYQDLTRISQSIRNGQFFQNRILIETMVEARKSGSALHLIGLVSNGGVHSHFTHLLALLKMAQQEGLARVYIHAILDGRDTPPASARPFLEQLYRHSIEPNNPGVIASICGRYYAMDRDRRWERTEKTYRAYVYGEGITATHPLSALEAAYGRGETDEFVTPVVIVDEEGLPLSTIRSQDSIICFNFRPDRARQITHALADEVFTAFNRGPKAPRPRYVTLTEYDRALPVKIAFPPEYLEGTLGEVVSSLGYPQLRVAETEKYAHVTFFLNGGREEPFPGEKRVLIPSPQVATYDLQPEMSARGVAVEIVSALRNRELPFIVANFANADMVGHTGDFSAAVKSVEAVDDSVGLIAEEASSRGWRAVICGDHGNAEQMTDDQGSPHTAHTANPVPAIVLTPEPVILNREGILADIAPTVLGLAGVDCPPQMTGRNLILSTACSCRSETDK